MNTPTPRTDARHVEVQMQDLQIGHQLRELINFARELERELTESRSWRDEAMLRLNNPLRHVIVENDLLRKMVDAFAECDCGDKWLMADYRELPHVRARKAK